jgi:3-oxoacyl-[acyl-carrier protein] reductase
MNRIDLDGRRAVVTGGAQGIGRAIAERLLASDASVALWDRDIALAEATAAELESKGSVAAIGVDVTDYASVEKAVAATGEARGGIDILVCNAGIAGPRPSSGTTRTTNGSRSSDIDLTQASSTA